MAYNKRTTLLAIDDDDGDGDDGDRRAKDRVVCL
jgi:hypothetical protein